MKNIVKEFKEFISRGSVIDLAVGMIVGSAFTKIVTSLVNDVLMPAIGVILGGINFTSLTIKFKDATIYYGNFIQNIIDFLIVAFCIFMFVKTINAIANKTKKKEEKKEEEPKKSDEVLLTEYKNGSQQAFNELYERYKKIIKYYTRNLFLLGADDDDLIQEGLLGFINAANTFTEGKCLFKTYAYRCIKNSLYSAIKKNLSDYEYTIWHSYMLGKTAKEIGEMLGKDEKSVSNAVYRIRKKLRALLK